VGHRGTDRGQLGVALEAFEDVVGVVWFTFRGGKRRKEPTVSSRGPRLVHENEIGDGQQPRQQRPVNDSHLGAAPPRFQEDECDNVFSVCDMADVSVCLTEDPFPVAVEEDGEGTFCA
jgi:hypothetical protein